LESNKSTKRETINAKEFLKQTLNVSFFQDQKLIFITRRCKCTAFASQPVEICMLSRKNVGAHCKYEKIFSRFQLVSMHVVTVLMTCMMCHMQGHPLIVLYFTDLSRRFSILLNRKVSYHVHKRRSGSFIVPVRTVQTHFCVTHLNSIFPSMPYLLSEFLTLRFMHLCHHTVHAL
jgi:hypothetical protein